MNLAKILSLISCTRALLSKHAIFASGILLGYVVGVFAFNHEWYRSSYYWLLLLIAIHGVSIWHRFLRRDNFGFYVKQFRHGDGDFSVLARWIIALVSLTFILLLPLILGNFETYFDN